MTPSKRLRDVFGTQLLTDNEANAIKTSEDMMTPEQLAEHRAGLAVIAAVLHPSPST